MNNLNPIFGEILAAHFPALPDTHRGWSLSFDYPPIPVRDFDWSATHPDYDGEGDNRIVHGTDRAAIIAAIDAWYEDQQTMTYENGWHFMADGNGKRVSPSFRSSAEVLKWTAA